MEWVYRGRNRVFMSECMEAGQYGEWDDRDVEN